MARPAFRLPRRRDSRRAWEASSLISLLLHGLALGASGFALHIAKLPDTGVTIDLDMVAVAAQQPQAPLTPPMQETASRADPDEAIAPKKAPKPAPRKAGARKQEQIRKTAVPKAEGQSQQTAGKALANAKPASDPPTPPAPPGSAPRPVYPELARKRGQEGTVNVRCQIDAQGNVAAVTIVKSSGFKLLDEAALRAVSKWKFRPGRKDGSNVAGTVIVPVQFRLQ